MCSTAKCYAIEPATTTATAGGGAEFVTFGAEVIANIIEQFGWEWTRTYACCVSFGDTQHVIEITGADATTRTGTTSGGIG